MQIKCENCGTLQPVAESYQFDNGDVLAKCKSGCGMSFEVVSAETVKNAEANHYPSVAGIITKGWQRKKMLRDRHEKVVADLESSEGATVSPEPKQATAPPQAATAPKPSQPKEPEAEAPAKSSSDAVYDDAKRRAAAAGQAPYEPKTDNPVLADAMRRARQ